MFAYTITITNTGSAAAQLISRHWIITDANNKVQEVRGLGVVGEQPLCVRARASNTPAARPSRRRSAPCAAATRWWRTTAHKFDVADPGIHAVDAARAALTAADYFRGSLS